MSAVLLNIGLRHYLLVSLMVFALGLYCGLTHKNAIGILMGVELVLNSASIGPLRRPDRRRLRHHAGRGRDRAS